MPNNTQAKDVRTLGYVLRRTNYGEADRILNIITPNGKVSAIAKGVRRVKSKLAGGIEMFSLIDLNIHFGKSEMATITSAKMVKYYGNILKDLNKVELMAAVLKKINALAETSDNSEYFEIVDQCSVGLDLGLNIQLVEGWFLLNMTRAMGEEINLYRDIDGIKLVQGTNYDYDVAERALFKNDGGELGTEEIKVLRLMSTNKLLMISKIKDIDNMSQKILKLARLMSGAI